MHFIIYGSCNSSRHPTEINQINTQAQPNQSEKPMTPPQNGRCWIGFEYEIAQCIENQYVGSEDTGLLRGSDKISVVQLDVDSAFENVTYHQAANGH